MICQFNDYNSIYCAFLTPQGNFYMISILSIIKIFIIWNV